MSTPSTPAPATAINIAEATRVIASGNLHEMTGFFLNASPQKEILLQKLRRVLPYFDEPLGCLSVSDYRIIGGSPVLLCSGYSHSGLGLPFGFFILGALQDVFVPYQGAGFVGTRLCSEILDNADVSNSARDPSREMELFSSMVFAYAPDAKQEARFHEKAKRLATTYDYYSELMSLLPARGVNFEVMWKTLQEHVVF